MVKQARMAEKFFSSRRAWKVWTDQLEQKRRQKKLQAFEDLKVQRCFQGKLTDVFLTQYMAHSNRQ